jgi:CubicO group peptidase (beta-lactamase class C family)
MRTRTLVPLALLGTIALAAAAGCGVRVSSSPAPSPRPSAASTAPSPSATPSATLKVPPPSPTPSAEPSALAAAERRAAATVSVKAILPRFDALAQDIFARSGVPGAAIAVVAGDGAVYVRCFGVREAGRPEKVDKDTVFQLASVSKSFTSAMLAALVTEHEIAWDDPVEKYWPEFALWEPWVSRHVTFRDLMAQRSGLPEYAGDELEQFGYGRREILRRLRYLPPAAGFRAAYAYQNALPTAAAEAASAATGRSWETLVRTRVLRPLGMGATVLTQRGYLAAPDRASSHALVDGALAVQAPEDDEIFAPAGGVSSTIADMVPYLRMQLNDGALGGARVAGAEALDATHTATTASGQNDEGPTAAALGWQTASLDGRLIVQHGGDFVRGVSALATMVPRDGVGVVVLTNAFPQGHALTYALTDTLIDLYTKGAVQEDRLVQQQKLAEEAMKGSILDPYRHLPGQPPAGASAPRPRGVYEGVYANDYYGRVTVLRGASAGLKVKLGRGITLRYVPWNGDTWRQPESDTAASFTVNGGRAVRVRIVQLDFRGRDGLFRRVN